MKDAIKWLIKKGFMFKYTKNDKRDWDDSSKSKHSLDKIIDYVTQGKEANNEEKAVHKGNHQHITSITSGAHEQILCPRG